MGRAIPGVVAICAALGIAVAASSATHATDVPVLRGTWDITTRVLSNSDATGWLGPTYEVGASNKRTWRFEQPCKGTDCKTDLVRITDVSQAKTRIAYRGGNEFAWTESLTSPETCNGKTFTGLTVRTSFVMKVKTVPVPGSRPFATSLDAVGTFVLTADLAAYRDAGCSQPPAQIRYTIRYTGKSPEAPPRTNQVSGGSAPGFARGTVKVPGKAAKPIAAGQLIPRGTVIDVSNGRGVRLVDTKGAKTVFSGQRGGVPSVFVFTGVAGGFAELRLTGGSFKACTAEQDVRKLWAKGSGKFRTKGRYASATRGTWWLTADTCTGTLVQVKRGVATVRDLAKQRNITVRAGTSYSAGP